jgi:hypothetical protein
MLHRRQKTTKLGLINGQPLHDRHNCSITPGTRVAKSVTSNSINPSHAERDDGVATAQFLRELAEVV